MKAHPPTDIQAARAKIREYEARIGELLATEPGEAIETLRRLYRLAIAINDASQASAALVTLGVAHSLVGQLRAAERVLNLAVRASPDWHMPSAELAVLHELLADRALARGDRAEALRRYSDAACLHQKARQIIAGGRDASGTVERAVAEQEREDWCRKELATIRALGSSKDG